MYEDLDGRGGGIETGSVNSMFELYVVRCGSRNRYQKDMYSKKIELHVSNLMTTVRGELLVVTDEPVGFEK